MSKDTGVPADAAFDDRNKLERAKKLITEVYESNYGSPRSSKETKKLETIIRKIDSILQETTGGKE